MSRIQLFFSLSFSILFVFFAMMDSAQALAKGKGVSLGGDSSISFGLGVIGASQTDLNSIIDAANASGNGPISTKNFSSAYEFYAQYSLRFSGSIYGFVFRPSYFMQSTTGTGTNGSYDYKLTGFTLFPMLRLYPLENSFMKFYMQGGIGWEN